MRAELDTNYFRRRPEMKSYRVQVTWKGYQFVEEYFCTEKQVKEIVKEFKQLPDRPWRVKIL